MLPPSLLFLKWFDINYRNKKWRQVQPDIQVITEEALHMRTHPSTDLIGGLSLAEIGRTVFTTTKAINSIGYVKQ